MFASNYAFSSFLSSKPQHSLRIVTTRFEIMLILFENVFEIDILLICHLAYSVEFSFPFLCFIMFHSYFVLLLFSLINKVSAKTFYHE